MNNTLIARDSKGKIRVLNFKLIENTQENSSTFYTIERTSGLYKGKATNQPTLTILQGKAKRTVKEQALLQYKALLKKAQDKGYKDIETFGYTSLSSFDPEKALPKSNTDQNGIKLHMLCKIFNTEDKKSIEKEYLGSAKLDGVRSFLYYKDGKVLTKSRGGQDYNIAAQYIISDPYINSIFQEHPDLILDGEIYRHGWPLSKISGLCRLETLTDDHKELKFYCYDILDENLSFQDRLAVLNSIKQDCPEDSKLYIVKHSKVKGVDQIMNLHDYYITRGYEGLVVRDPEATYKCGGRDRRMQKIKIFKDAEFKILGLVEGARDEDFCFLMETSEGNQFKAKPVGDVNDRQWYRDHINDLIGKMGTVKYFGMTTTDKPVPNLPIFKSVRSDKDI